MKKAIIMIVVMVLGLIGIAIANNVVLLGVHSLEYYYTPKGMLLTTVVCGLEFLALIPVIGWYVKKFFLTDDKQKEES